MYPRKYSLKNPYFVLKYGSVVENDYFIIRLLNPNDLDSLSTIDESIKNKLNSQESALFCVIISNKFSKKASVKNKLRRLIAKEVANFIKTSLVKGWFVIIPKKRLLDENGKIIGNVKEVGAKINSLLSKIPVS